VLWRDTPLAAGAQMVERRLPTGTPQAGCRAPANDVRGRASRGTPL